MAAHQGTCFIACCHVVCKIYAPAGDVMLAREQLHCVWSRATQGRVMLMVPYRLHGRDNLKLYIVMDSMQTAPLAQALAM